MNNPQDSLLQARALQADILASPTVWLPRRDILLEWLTGFLTRAAVTKYVPTETEVTDLVALAQFLRTRKVPVAA
jgi:CO dehydrogenase/acetyl-CoA synthase beta subunit